MAVELMGAVMRSSIEGTNNRFVLLALADRADDSGYCYPGHANLMRKTGLSESSVKRAIRFLEEQKLLRRVARWTEQGRQRSNYYRIEIRQLQSLRVEDADEEKNELDALFEEQEEQGAAEGVTQTPSPASGEGVTQTPRSHRPREGVTQTPPGGSHRPPYTSQDPSDDVVDSPPTGESLSPDCDSIKVVAKPRSDVQALCDHLADRIAEDGSKRPTISKTWLDAARLMIDRDGRDPEKAHRLIDWCQSDSFWRSNIMSMPKFRSQYDQLRKKANEEHAKRKKRPTTTDGVRSALRLAERYRAQEAAEEAARSAHDFGGDDGPPQLRGTG